MDLDALAKEFPLLKQKVDRIFKHLGEQSVGGSIDGLTDAQRVAVANGEKVPEVEDAKPITRGEVREMIREMIHQFGHAVRPINERLDAFAQTGVDIHQRIDALQTKQDAAPAGPMFPGADGKASGFQGQKTTEEVDQAAKDGIARAGSDVQGSDAGGSIAGAGNPSGARDALSAQAGAPTAEPQVGVNGKPLVRNATTAPAGSVEAAQANAAPLGPSMG